MRDPTPIPTNPSLSPKRFVPLHISFADALLLIPRFALTIKNLLMNKEKLFELAKIPLNENCLAMLLKKLLEKLGDPCNPSLTSFETSDSLLEVFADEVALLDSFPPRNEDVDFEAELREIELLLNRDPSTNFSLTITIDPNPERFTDEPALACLPPPGDDKSFLKEDVQEEIFQVYSNPLFEFDDNYNSSDINPLFKEILEDVESKDSNVSNFDEPVLLNTPLFDEDECFDLGGEIDKIDAFMDAYNDSEGDVHGVFCINTHAYTHNLFPPEVLLIMTKGLKG
ncbi:hypothetical protein Tco_1104171 [Tanacetum coccineum]